MSSEKTAFVSLERIHKSYGGVIALDDVTLSIGENQFLTLLGPSGSGKTTCLRAIAGMIPLDSGRLRVSGRDVSSVPMNKRNIGMVFQNYSLFPHMSVAENVGYPLRVRRTGSAEAQQKVDRALSLVRLQGYGGRRPHELSGGQQQRVALARALVFSPDVLLLDEPLSALDRVLREEMQYELRRIHQEIGTTMICVTHDRSEALTMSDRIVVMKSGKIVQDDAPADIYMRSNSRFVAELLGEVNVIPVTVQDEGRTVVDMAGRHLALGKEAPVTRGQADLVVRVESVGIAGGTAVSDAAKTWTGVVKEALFLGDAVRFVVDAPPHTITARLPIERARGIAAGHHVSIDLAMEEPMLFPAMR
jgi:putative spermidine/putrescine transport system ATP-binding protein